MVKIDNFNQLLLLSKALGNPLRLEILTILNKGGRYISELARELNTGRTVMYLHLNKLEEAGIISGEHKISNEGKSLKYYYINEFYFTIDNKLINDLSEKNMEI